MEVTRLLQEWQVEEAVPYLEARNIVDQAALKLLRPEHADFIFPKEQFGLQLKFFHALDLWQRSETTAETPTTVPVNEPVQNTKETPTECEIEVECELEVESAPEPECKRRKVARPKPLQSVASKAVADLDLKSVLQQNERGQAVLEFYETSNILTNRHRDVLTAIIVDELKKISHGLKNKDFKAAAIKVKDLFPSEDVEIYYLDPGCGGNNTRMSVGKIPRRYRNIDSQTKSLLEPSASTSSAANSLVAGNKDPYQAVLKAVITPEITAAVLWLKTDAPTANDWPLMKRKWALSAPQRLKDYFNDKSDKALGSYFETFSTLTFPSGYTLFEVDFNFLYPEKDMILVQKWDVFVKKTLTLALSEVSDAVARDCLAISKTTQHPGSLAVLCLAILPALCPPTKKVLSKANKLVKISIAQSRSALYLHVTDLSHLTKELKERRALLSSNKKEYQPFLVFVGPKLNDIKHSYVDVAGISYRLTSPSKAIDVCFKAIVACHLEFPAECRRVWMLIQRVIYDITTKWDTDIPFGTISSLKGLAVPQ